MSDDDRLYGLPYAEHLKSDLEAVYECWASDNYETPGPGDGLTIEEWTTTPLRSSMPDVATLIEWISDCVLDDVGMEDARDCVVEAATEEVAAAFSVALDLFGSRMIGWRMTDKLVASHKITHDAKGEPYVDGELMYRSSNS